jgi:hypothetical protein
MFKYQCKICGLRTNNVRYLNTQDCIDGTPVCEPCFEDAINAVKQLEQARRIVKLSWFKKLLRRLYES